MSLSDYRNALVTGASSGIGEAVVTALSAAGLEVHAIARRTGRLQQLQQQTQCRIHTLDLTDTAALQHLGSLEPWDIVINNAGILRGYEKLHNTSVDDIDQSIDTNVRALYHLLRAALPGMIERRRGHIVNVGSMAGLYALQSALYGGSKAAVHLLSQNLRLELQGTGIRVTEICPGRVATEIYDRGIADSAQRQQLKNTGIKELEPRDIAAAIRYALEAPWHVNINLIELQPTEQTYGGSQFVPFTRQ